jgi:hypothetical protein
MDFDDLVSIELAERSADGRNQSGDSLRTVHMTHSGWPRAAKLATINDLRHLGVPTLERTADSLLKAGSDAPIVLVSLGDGAGDRSLVAPVLVTRDGVSEIAVGVARSCWAPMMNTTPVALVEMPQGAPVPSRVVLTTGGRCR